MRRGTVRIPLDLVVVGEMPLDVLGDFEPTISRAGGAAYSAFAAAAQGASVGIVGTLGTAAVPGLMELLKYLEVDLRGVRNSRSAGIRYHIYNADEILPQQVRVQGREPPRTRQILPADYAGAKCVLIYPGSHNRLEIARAAKSSGGLVCIDLQHDIDNLADLESLVGLSDVVLGSRQELLVTSGASRELEVVSTLHRMGASSVVVKYGMGGSAIYRAGAPVIQVPAFLADFKCTVGAGDVYNAIFAQQYALGADLAVAGKLAAVAASLFCEEPHSPAWVGRLLGKDLLREAGRRTPVIAPPECLSSVRIYLAGHFMSVPMKRWTDLVANVLEARGFGVFSPSRDAGVLSATDGHYERRRTFESDLRALEAASAVVALLDGQGNGGTAWELGFAHAKGIPIFGLHTDHTLPLSNMVEQSCRFMASTLAQMLNELYGALGSVIEFPQPEVCAERPT